MFSLINLSFFSSVWDMVGRYVSSSKSMRLVYLDSCGVPAKCIVFLGMWILGMWFPLCSICQNVIISYMTYLTHATNVVRLRVWSKPNQNWPKIDWFGLKNIQLELFSSVLGWKLFILNWSWIVLFGFGLDWKPIQPKPTLRFSIIMIYILELWYLKFKVM